MSRVALGSLGERPGLQSSVPRRNHDERTRQDSRLGPTGNPENVWVCGQPGDRSTRDHTSAGARLGTVTTSCSGRRLWMLGVGSASRWGVGGCSPVSVPSQAAGCRPCGLGRRGVYCVLTWRGAVAPQGARSVHGPAVQGLATCLQLWTRELSPFAGCVLFQPQAQV